MIGMKLKGSSLPEIESEYRDWRCHFTWWILQLGEVRWNNTGAVIYQLNQEKRQIDQKTCSVTTSIIDLGASNKVWIWRKFFDQSSRTPRKRNPRTLKSIPRPAKNPCLGQLLGTGRLETIRLDIKSWGNVNSFNRHGNAAYIGLHWTCF